MIICLPDGYSVRWLRWDSLDDFWANMPEDVVMFPDTPAGWPGSASYIARIPYEGGLYIAMLRHHSPELIYLTYGGVEMNPIMNEGLEVMTMNQSRCSWKTVDTSVISSYPGTLAVMYNIDRDLQIQKLGYNLKLCEEHPDRLHRANGILLYLYHCMNEATG